MKIFSTLALILFATIAGAQTLTIVSPEGLTAPYEVAPNTEVTFKWDYFGESPTLSFTYDQEPDFSSQPGTDPAWTQFSSFTDNGDGTFNFTTTVTEEMWVWAGYYQSFLGSYSFSNVFHFQVASGIVISYEDGHLCPGGNDSELLTVGDSYDSYQWFRDNEAIAGATSSTYSATEPGSYKVQVPFEGGTAFSNTLVISDFSLSFSGIYDTDLNALTLSATSGYDSYQWYSGSDSASMTAIDGATSLMYFTSLPGEATWYAVEGSNGSCTLMSDARAVQPATFEIPVITVAADTNDFGHICNGTEVNMSTGDNYGGYLWLINGQDAYNTSSSLSISQSYQSGNYSVQVSPPGWPEILMESAVVDVSFFTVTSPSLFSDDSDNKYCPGQTVNVTLSDEGYNYTWYAYAGYEYTDADLVDVPGNTYTFTYDSTITLTVVAEHEGCTSSANKNLNSWEQESPYISLDDYNDQYLCTDSLASMRVSSWSAGNYQDYQWMSFTDGVGTPITDSTMTSFTASDTGYYAVQVSPVSCPSVTLISNTIQIQSYLDRELYIYADMEQLCIGDTTNLNISGGYQWQDIQWFARNINGFNPNVETYDPLIGGGSTATQEVSEFKQYQVKARFTGCPTGLKIVSNVVAITPRVNPTLSFDPDYGVEDVKDGPFGGIDHRVYCLDQTIGVSIPEGYASYQWLSQAYSALNYYKPTEGTIMADADSNTLSYSPDGPYWITAVVDSAGCLGYSDPVLLDQWVFLEPSIVSYGNSELCSEGDSTLLHTLPGDWSSYQWYLDGVPVPNSNNDSIYATQPGMYVVETVPTLCPGFTYTSGVGPIVSFLQASIAENDTVIYALPEMGTYTYQWYLDGNPIASPPNISWILYKAEMEDGVYTVAVTNPDSCTSISDPFIWNVTGVNEKSGNDFRVYPNPAVDVVFISGVDIAAVRSVSLVDMQGKVVFVKESPTQKSLQVASLSPGVYLVKILMKDGNFALRKIVKN